MAAIRSANPIVQGAGTPVFGADSAVTEAALESARTFKNGVLDRTYGRKR